MPADLSAERFIDRLRALGSPFARENVERQFRTGAEDDFFNVRMRDVFDLAKEFVDMPIGEIDKLLESQVHEVRVGAVSVMGKQFMKKQTTPERKKELFELYLRRTDRINDWDLVDVSAHQVIGGYLLDKPRDVLYELARSEHWWERRIAVFATLTLIRKGDLDDLFRLAELLVDDEYDLVQKVVGGMLREAGKHDRARLLAYLDRYAAVAPRLLLSDAMEHLDKDQRAYYRSLKAK
ncbi:DNA alkylation repair protein [Nonomuraea sp. B12E4]|uniref:DNA alkylation repair protein n=1 Tax=Nonomuraea sp. B12E4 TaxID=3153564 RepID=UPI00325E1D10